MKRFLLTAILAVAATSALATDVGVSVTVGQPGFYGRIDIGDTYPQPRLIYRDPIIIQRAPVSVRPAYLHVPPGHAKHWSKHCHKYNACNRPVYFVQDDWYNEVYVPYYREVRGDNHGGHGYKDHGKQGKPDKPGYGNGHGNGKNNGHGKGHHDD